MAKKILRWLLSNLLLILVIVSVIYGYIYWGNLTGGNTPAGKAVALLSKKFDGIDEFVEGVKNKQARLSGTKIDQQSGEQLGKHINQQAVAEIGTDAGADILETEKPAAEMPAADSSENTQKNSPQENMSQDVATEEMATEKQNVADIQSTSQNNAETNTSDNEDTASGQSNLELIDQANSNSSVAEISNEQMNNEQINAEQAVTDSPQPEPEQQPVSISYSHNNTRVKQNSDGEIESLPQAQSLTAKTEDLLKPELVVETTESTSENDASKDGFISPEVAAQLESVNEDGALENDGLIDDAPVGEVLSAVTQLPTVKTEMSIQDTWVLARKSFYQKNFDLSVQSYKSVIAATKDNFDAYGELGNVYFSQGQKAQAADAYLRAATILLTKGDNQRAQSLLRVLQQLDMSKANQLQHLMDMPSL